jgi:hypothetical protein
MWLNLCNVVRWYLTYSIYMSMVVEGRDYVFIRLIFGLIDSLGTCLS